MVDISVIIPIYNSELYLRECLNSVINQTFEDIEIICINDGSTDSSLAILNEYGRLDERITIINQENKGIGFSRNIGIEQSNGKYLFFLDADDYIELNTLEELFNCAEKKKIDVLLYQIMNYESDSDKLYQTDNYSMEGVYEFIKDGTVDYKDLGDLIFSIPVTPFGKLYNAHFIKQNNIKFPEGLIFEDNIFYWDVIFLARKIAFYHKHLYIRRRYSDSITSNNNSNFIDSIEINRRIVGKFRQYNYLDKFKSRIYNRRMYSTYSRFVEIRSEFQELYFEKLQQDYKKIVDDGLYDDYVRNLSERNTTIFKTCLEAGTYLEFKYRMAFWDSKVTRKKKDKEIKDLKNKINNLNKENTKFKKDIAGLEDKNSILNDNVESLAKETSSLNNDLNAFKNDIDVLQELNQTLENKNLKLHNEVVDLSNENVLLNDRNKNLSNENVLLSDRNENLSKENVLLSDRNENLYQENLLLNEKYENQVLINDDFKENIQNLNEDMKYLKVENLSLKERIGFLKKDNYY